MTNWSISEKVQYGCPHCNRYTDSWHVICPMCNQRVVEKIRPHTSKVNVTLGMNGGNRREFYTMYLTDAENQRLNDAEDVGEIMDLILEDFEPYLTNVIIDAGTDYEGMCHEIS